MKFNVKIGLLVLAMSFLPQGVMAAEQITVGIENHRPPMVFMNSVGQLTGLDFEVMTEAFKRMNIPLKYKIIDWATKDSELFEKKSIDMIWTGMIITEARKEKYLFSIPYIESNQVVAVSMDSPIQQLDDLVDKTICVQEGSTADTLITQMKQDGKVDDVLRIGTVSDGLVKVVTAKCDAMVYNNVTLGYYMKSSKGRFRFLDETLLRGSFGVALRPEDTELVKKLNKALKSMDEDGTLDAIQKYYLSK